MFKNKIHVFIFFVALLISQVALFVSEAYTDAMDGGYIYVIVGVPFVFSAIITFIYDTFTTE